MPAHHIDEVIENLGQIVAKARQSGSRLGYFPALYRKVTAEVARGIQAGTFEDGPRMEWLDVVFANRYLDAFDAYQKGQGSSLCWNLAFRTADEWWPIVLQHLLLGINAHINLDLGIAAATACPGSSLMSLKGDFDRINAILASLVDGVKRELAGIWPMFTLLDHASGKADDAIINFSMRKARDCAWNVAQSLAGMNSADWPSVIEPLDSRIAALGAVVHHPGWVQGALLKVVRLGERGTVSEVIELLS